MDEWKAEEKARTGLRTLLQRRGVPCALNDLWVKEVTTRRGDLLYLVIGLNGTEAPLTNIIRKVGGRRETRVGFGVFLLRPDDLTKLISRGVPEADA